MPTPIPETPPEYDNTRILERPDGFYWQDRITGDEFGPFPTLLGAVEDMGYNAESDVEFADGLQEAGDELGIADWVDPETGELAEESVPHIEDH